MKGMPLSMKISLMKLILITAGEKDHPPSDA